MARSPQPAPFRHPALDYKPPLFLRAIRWALMAIVAVALLSAAYTGYWFYVASAFRDGLPSWVERMAGEGATLGYRKLEISGYPLQFRIIFAEPLLNAPAMPAASGAPVRWSATRAQAMMSPWNFNRYTIDLAGTHDITWAGQRISGAADMLTVETRLHDDGLPREAKIDALRLRFQGAAPWSVERAQVSIRRLFPATNEAGQATASGEIQADNLRLPESWTTPLSRDFAHLGGDFRVMGALDDPTSYAGLARWRDAGGTIEFNLADTRYGPLGASANGTFAFDEAMQPLIAATAKVSGLFTAIDALRDKDMVRSRDASMAKVVLGALQKPGDNGGPPTVSLPFTVQQGWLYAGPVQLMEIPPIKWQRDLRPVLRR